MDMVGSNAAKMAIFSDRGDVGHPGALTPIEKRIAQQDWRNSGWMSESILVGLLRITDCLVVLISGLLAFVSRFSSLAYLQPPESYALATGALLAMNIFWCAGLYGNGRLQGIDGRTSRLMAAWGLVILILIALAFVTKTAEQASRLWVGLWFVYGLVGLVGVRCAFTHLTRYLRRRGRFTRNLVVAGAGAQGQRFAEHMRRTADGSIRFLGFFDDDWHRLPQYVGGYPVLGTIDDLIRFASDHSIDIIVIALPWHAEDVLLAWAKQLRQLPADVYFFWPGMTNPPFAFRRLISLGGVSLLNMFERPLSGWSHIAKTLEDRLLAAFLLLMCAPLMLLIALAVRLDSPGGALFRQQRYGYNNEVIDVLKFRTMHYEPELTRQTQFQQATKNDPRITRVGRWLRRTSLDELPQLFNVLRGEMSLVGPRPHPVELHEQFAPLIDAYQARHRVKPGITGWAQVNGFRGETETPDKMERRIHYDLYYIDNWSILFDLRILVRTLLVGFVHPRAY